MMILPSCFCPVIRESRVTEVLHLVQELCRVQDGDGFHHVLEGKILQHVLIEHLQLLLIQVGGKNPLQLLRPVHGDNVLQCDKGTPSISGLNSPMIHFTRYLAKISSRLPFFYQTVVIVGDKPDRNAGVGALEESAP